MKKNYIKYILIMALATFCFWLIDDVCALQNLGALSNLTIDENGRFYNNVNNTSSSIGFAVYTTGEGDLSYYSAFPTGSTTYTHGGAGGSIVQCNMPFVKDNYYSVSFYWLSDSASYYYHPYYTKLGNRLAIGDNPGLSYPNFTYDTVNSDIQRQLVDGLGYLSSYTVIFKAPRDGTCLLSTFSSNPTSPSDGLAYVGYTYESLGSKPLTADEMQNALQGQFNSVNSSINNSTSQIQGSINESNNQINSNINELKEKQDEQNETSKGIWATLTDGLGNIGKWFTDLAGSIGNFFKDLGEGIANGFGDLFKGIKSLFVGEEVCDTKNNFYNFPANGMLVIPAGKYSWPISYDDDKFHHLGGYSSSPLYFVSNSNLKPNTKYRIFLEYKNATENYSPFKTLTDFDTQLKYISSSGRVDHSSGVIYADFETKEDVSQQYSFGLSTPPKNAIDYRLVITDDLSMTVDNYEYFTKKEECTTSGGLFGIITNGLTSIGNWFGNLLTGILDGLKALFIPDGDYFSEYFSSLYDFFTEKLGILMYPLDLVADVLTRFMSLSDSSTGLIHIPTISIPFFGVLVEEQSFYLNENWNVEPISTLYTIYKAFVTCIIVLLLVNLARKKEKEIVDGSGS